MVSDDEDYEFRSPNSDDFFNPSRLIVSKIRKRKLNSGEDEKRFINIEPCPHYEVNITKGGSLNNRVSLISKFDTILFCIIIFSTYIMTWEEFIFSRSKGTEIMPIFHSSTTDFASKHGSSGGIAKFE